MTNTKEIYYSFPQENFRKKFTSEKEAMKFVENKIPANGKSFVLRKTTTEVIDTEFDSKKKAIYDINILKRIIDTFIEKANVNNISFHDTPYKVIDPRYENFTYGQAGVYYMAEQLGYPWEKLDALYANKDGIMNHRWDTEHHGYDTFEDREFYTNWLAPFFIIKDIFPEYHLDEKDITIYKYNYGHIERYEPEKLGSRKYIHYDDPDNTLAGKYPEMMKYYLKNWHSPSIFGKYYVEMPREEALELYKKRIKEYPIDKVTIEYNWGDFKPCHNYKINFPEEFDPEKKNFRSMKTFSRLPGIMFRNNDIYITNSNYIGRKVNHMGSKIPNMDEELYNYCTKNLI